MFPRQNTSAGALDWSRLVAAVFRPESLLMIFSRVKDFIQQKMVTERLPGGLRGRGHSQGVGRAPTPVVDWWVPLVLSLPNIFY